MNIGNKLDEFSRRWSEKNPDKCNGYCHSVYYITSEDMDGNITNEAYAMNCMTDYAIQILYLTYTNSSIGLFVGTGTTTPQPTSSKAMESYLAMATNISTGLSLDRNRFYSDTQILVTRFKIDEGYLDYTVFNENKTITEIGVGSDRNNLITHARVYDESGEPSSIVKKMNEKLTIRVYANLSCKIASIVNRNWDKGIACAINPYVLFKTHRDNGFYSLQFGLMATHLNSTYTSTGNFWNLTQRNFTNNVLSMTSSNDLYSNLYTDKYAYVSTVAFSNFENNIIYYVDNRMFFIYHPKLDTAEKIESTNLFTDNWNSSLFRYVFGYGTDNRSARIAGHIPVTDFDISGTDAGMWMYNCQDKDWTISENFVNAKNTVYGGCEFITKAILCSKWYFEEEDTTKTFRVYINEYPDIPISAILNTSNTIFYATDTYWDTTTWVQIQDLSNIDVSLRNKRYFVTFNTTNIGGVDSWPYSSYAVIGSNNRKYSFQTKREQTYHSIQPVTPYYYCNYGYYRPNPWRSDSSLIGKSVSNDTYGYIATMDWLLYPRTDDPNPDTYENASATNDEYWYRYPLRGVNNAFVSEYFLWNTKNGDRIIVQGNTSGSQYKGFRVYTPNMDPSIAPTYEDVLINVTPMFDANPHWSYSDEGYVAMSYRSGNNCVNTTYILDVYGSNNSPEIKTLTDHKFAHIIDLTKYIAAVNTTRTDVLSIDIIDMTDMSVYQTIDFTSTDTLSGMCGYEDYLYIRCLRESTYMTYLYRISTQTLVVLDTDINHLMNINSESYFRHIQRAVRGVGNCPSCMVMLSSITSTDYDQVSNHMLFNSEDPTHPSKIISPENDRTVSKGVYNQCAQLKYTNNNKQLLLTYTNYRPMVVDIGRILNEGQQPATKTLTARCVPTTDASYRNTGYSSVIFGQSVALLRPWTVSNSKSAVQAYMYPVEYFLPHKVIGYTRTICSYNNPKQVSMGKGINIQMSNNTANWDPVNE